MKKILLLIFTIASLSFAQSLEWVSSFKSRYGNASILDMKVDNSGNVFTLFFNSDSLDCNPELAEQIVGAPFSISIVKQSSSGSFIWAKTIEANMISGTSSKLLIDDDGNIYTFGYMISTVDFDPGPSTYNVTGSFKDNYIIKLNNDGELIWVKFLENSLISFGALYLFDIKIHNNFIYGIGQLNGTYDFDPGTPVVNLGTPGINYSVIFKWDINGNYINSQLLSTTDSRRIEINSDNDIYIAGETYHNDDLNHGSGEYFINDTNNSNYIIKLDSNYNFVWAKDFINESSHPLYHNYDIAVTSDNGVVIIGLFSSTNDFDSGSGVFNLTSNGNYNAYVLHFNTNGNLEWGKSYGSSDYDQIYDIEIFEDKIYLSGVIYSNDTVDFDPGSGVFEMNDTYGFGYVSILDDEGNFMNAFQNAGGSLGVSRCKKTAVNSSQYIHVAGDFNGSVDFDPSSSTYTLSNLLGSGNGDSYTQKIFLNNLSVEESQASSISIFPNPTTDFLYINTANIVDKELNITISDIQGKVIFKNIIQNSSSTFSIPTNSFAKGIYILNCNGKKIKFIKN